MNVVKAISQTAKDAGVEICFANAGTTELPLVATFDKVLGIRPVLGLFEGVCTGTDDGSAMYTVQSLRSPAQEKVNVLKIICCDRKYFTIEFECRRAGMNSLGEAVLGR